MAQESCCPNTDQFGEPLADGPCSLPDELVEMLLEAGPQGPIWLLAGVHSHIVSGDSP